MSGVVDHYASVLFGSSRPPFPVTHRRSITDLRVNGDSLDADPVPKVVAEMRNQTRLMALASRVRLLG